MQGRNRVCTSLTQFLPSVFFLPFYVSSKRNATALALRMRGVARLRYSSLVTLHSDRLDTPLFQLFFSASRVILRDANVEERIEKKKRKRKKRALNRFNYKEFCRWFLHLRLKGTALKNFSPLICPSNFSKMMIFNSSKTCLFY